MLARRSSRAARSFSCVEAPASDRSLSIDSVPTGARGIRCQALLIEADEPYAVAIGACVRLAGCRVELVMEPGAALAELEQRGFDLVVWGVAETETRPLVEVLGELRLRSQAPLILLDDGIDVTQLVLEAGADQWLPKPFVPGALVGAIRAALRKSASATVRVASKLEVRGMVLDGGKRALTFEGAEVFFTRQEWDLFMILASHPNRFLGAQEILRLGWRAGEHAAEQLRTYIHRLRHKIEPLNLPCHLASEHGQGYCLMFD
jgi:DNA-binding response OmpR family regulator